MAELIIEDTPQDYSLIVVPVGRKMRMAANDWGTPTEVPLPEAQKRMSDWGTPTEVPLSKGNDWGTPTEVPLQTAGSSRGVPAQAPVSVPPQPEQEPSPSRPTAELRPYNPSWRDTLHGATQDALTALGMEKGTAQKYADRFAGGMGEPIGAADAIPGLSQGLAGNQMKRDIDAGNYGHAAMDALGVVGGPIPGAGKVMGKAGSALLGPLKRASGLVGEASPARLTPAMRTASQAPFMADRITAGVAGNAREGAAEAVANKPNAAVGFLQDTFLPTSKGDSAKRAAGAARESLGLAEREGAQAHAALEDFRKQVNALSPQEQREFIGYIENRSKGWTLRDPSLQPMADELRRLNQAERAELEKLPDDLKPQFIDDYLRHYWKDPAAVKRAFYGGGRTPSGAFTKKRSLPTYEDGIAAGSEPVSTDPIQITLTSLDNSRRWRVQMELFTIGRGTGDVKFVMAGKIPPGMKALDRAFGRTRQGTVPVAPEGWADIYNNLCSRGSMGWGEHGKALYDKLAEANNTLTLAKLGFSGFHIFTEAKESIASQAGLAVGELLAGKPVKAAVRLSKAPFTPLADLRSTRYGGRGAKAIDEYSGVRVGSAVDKEAIDLLTRANFHFTPTRRDLMLSASGATQSGSLLKSFKRGSLGKEAREGVQETTRAWASRPMRQAIKTAIGATAGGLAAGPIGVGVGAAIGGGGLRGLARVADTIAAPIFETAVPRMKVAAAMRKMQSWLELNPTASNAEKLGMARKISDSMDNRFGELVQDDLFLNNTVNDIARLVFLSPTWNIGTAREILGVFPELAASLNAVGKGETAGRYLESGAKMKGGNLKAEYLAGLFISSYALGTTYQYFMTGDATPTAFPKTGGTLPANRYRPELAERAQLPGYDKDVVTFAEAVKGLARGDPSAFYQELQNKGSPITALGTVILTGRDWRSDTIKTPGAGALGYGKGALTKLGEAFVPISAGQDRKEGSAIGPGQRLMGIRPAGMAVQDPIGLEGIQESKEERDYQQKLHHDANALRQQGKSEEAATIEREINKRKMEARRKAAERKRSYGGPQ